jgi:ABC-type polar amino acid transport system ATPase subunit
MAVKDDDVMKNKNALLDEMGSALSVMNEFVNDSIEKCEDGNSANLLSSVIGMAHQIGFITAVFNKYIVFERGLMEDETKIGFGALFSGKAKS